MFSIVGAWFTIHHRRPNAGDSRDAMASRDNSTVPLERLIVAAAPLPPTLMLFYW